MSNIILLNKQKLFYLIFLIKYVESDIMLRNLFWGDIDIFLNTCQIL